MDESRRHDRERRTSSQPRGRSTDRGAVGTGDSAPRPTRRRYLGGLVTASVAALGGCVGDGDDSVDDASDGDADDGTPDTAPELVFDDLALSDSFPLEFAEPDTEPYTGFGAPDQVVANVQWHPDGDSHWHFQPLEVPLDGERRVRTRFVTVEGEETPLGEDAPYHQAVVTTEDTPDDLVSIEVDGALVTVSGEREGTGHLVVELWRDEDRLWRTPELEFEVA